MRLQGKTAVISGGSSGIGLAAAKAFVAEGARVAITGRDSAALETAAREIGHSTLAVPCDHAVVEQIDSLSHRLANEFDGLDILFANAGLFTNAPIGKITEAEFDAVFALNVKGVFFTVQSLLPLFR